MSQKVMIIANPKAGLGKIRAYLFSVVEILSAAGYEVTVYPTKNPQDAYNKIREGIEDFDKIIVCGGDGTLNEVVSGVVSSGVDATIGYIPAGTLNEWSSGLKISRNIEQAAEDIVSGTVRELDVGRFDDKFFTYTASFGAFTEASYSAPQEVKNVIGQAAYFFEGIKSIAHIKPISLEIEADGRTIKGDFLFGAISNSHSVGGVLKLDENVVNLGDGYFEVLLIRNPDTLQQLQQIVDGILKKDFDRKGLEFFKASKIKVKSKKPLDWTLDGEHAVGSGETVIENLHHRMKFIVPNR